MNPRSFTQRVREAGDAALLLELEPVVDPEVNARAVAIAAAVRRQAIPGVRDVVPTYRSVCIHFDPLRTIVEAIAEALKLGSEAAVRATPREPIEIPVLYGGEDGPDLEEVARFAGLTPDEVIARHTGGVYRVYMLGFLPGFAYMGRVDARIAAPRRPSPRSRVPAGSVAIAGEQTGIYPSDSPGGWQLIGRTGVKTFDPATAEPALFAAGDTVRFRRVVDRGQAGEGDAPDRRGIVTATSARPQSAGPMITVLQPGLLTTVQDSGRWGYQDRGVPIAGAMDGVSHRMANLLVGNPADAAALEATLTGPTLRMDSDMVFALTGADLSATLDGAPLPLRRPVGCRRGSVLRFGDRQAGARAYVAFAGGITVPMVLGSRSTHVLSQLGGISGRALRGGDCLAIGAPAAQPRRHVAAAAQPSGGARLRVLAGPQDDFFDPGMFEVLERTRFTISSQSDRMGYRLAGKSAILPNPGREMISDAAFMGSVQAPPSGDPILLMADRPTTGGYPQIATVITADLPLAGQLAPGDWIEFALCTRAEAVAALIVQERELLAVR